MRILQHLKIVRAGLIISVLMFGGASVGASSANISHSYKSSASVPIGSLVSLDPLQSDSVQLANSENGARLMGVAVVSNDSLLAVNSSTNLTQVATSGTVNTLISTINGPIRTGDQVSVSPFSGIGMKTDPGGHVIGLAQTAFTSSSTGAKTQQVTDKSGKTAKVVIGYVRLGIAIGTAASSVNDTSSNAMQRLARSITGHPVSTLRAVISLLIILVAVAALVPLIYASIYGGIISIGRNPLAKYAIFRSVSSVLAMAVLTAAVAGVTVYLLLR